MNTLTKKNCLSLKRFSRIKSHGNCYFLVNHFFLLKRTVNEFFLTNFSERRGLTSEKWEEHWSRRRSSTSNKADVHLARRELLMSNEQLGGKEPELPCKGSDTAPSSCQGRAFLRKHFSETPSAKRGHAATRETSVCYNTVPDEMGRISVPRSLYEPWASSTGVKSTCLSWTKTAPTFMLGAVWHLHPTARVSDSVTGEGSSARR